MALLEKHRSALYRHFVQHVGEEAAEAMLAQFPSRDLDEPVTKEFVALQIAQLRNELKDDIHRQTDRVLTRLQVEGAIALILLAIVNAFVG